uniref:Uncharacterized protein n=1 Tax=Rhizophora mucronata TaxID=61149 RepID=A0A2P2NZ95_RHIMU
MSKVRGYYTISLEQSIRTHKQADSLDPFFSLNFYLPGVLHHWQLEKAPFKLF